jgi:hypothetical protein
MINELEVFSYIQNFPVIQIILGIIALFWILFSFSITYHWIVYGRNILLTIIVLILYYGVSLFLIGSLLSRLSYV